MAAKVTFEEARRAARDLTLRGATLDTVAETLEVVMADLSRISQEVAEARTVNESARTLISRLAQEIRDNATDQAALNALADDLDAQTAGLASDVAENTAAEAENTAAEAETPTGPTGDNPTGSEPSTGSGAPGDVNESGTETLPTGGAPTQPDVNTSQPPTP